jgi:hypothetical protein
MRKLLFASLIGGTILAAGIGGAQAKAKLPAKVVNGKIVTDHLLTAGQPETILVRKLPPKIRFFLAVAPSPVRSQSCDAGLCLTDPISPAPGSAPFRTSAKGRALVTFIAPASYTLISFRIPGGPRTFTNGEAVEITVDAERVRHGVLILAEALANAVVEVPPPPSP